MNKTIIILCIFVALILYIFASGRWQYQRGFEAGRDSQRILITTLEADKKERDRIIAQISKEYEEMQIQRQQQKEIKYETIKQIVEKPVYIHECIDDDGLSELNAQIKAGNSKN